MGIAVLSPLNTRRTAVSAVLVCSSTDRRAESHCGVGTVQRVLMLITVQHY